MFLNFPWEVRVKRTLLLHNYLKLNVIFSYLLGGMIIAQIYIRKITEQVPL